MTYRKPEIELLGTALNVIQTPPPLKIVSPTDGVSDPNHVANPAYDLDE